ncbi:hypothetical protein VTO42DRAFT_1536 [Malbranchea cinnamomea]
MELTVIPFSEVSLSLQQARDDWRETDDFNTHGHSHEEINAIVPETQSLRHIRPPQWPGRYSNWIGLIMESQGVTDWHVFELPRCLSDMFEDLAAMFPKFTTIGLSTKSVFVEGHQWFLRLEYAGPKDGENGASPISTVEAVIERLCTSARARWALVGDLNEDPTRRPKVYLTPFNWSMDPRHGPHRSPSLTQTKRKNTHSTFMKAHDRIIKHAENLGSRLGNGLLEAIKRQGFTFDVLMGQDGTVRLVEINSFGAMSPCGSCLFHWIKDARHLYGLENSVQVRIAL